MCPFPFWDFQVLIPWSGVHMNLWDLRRWWWLYFYFISVVIKTPKISEYVSENLCLLFDLLIAKFRKFKLFLSWFLTAPSGDIAGSHLKLWPDQRSPLSSQYTKDCFQAKGLQQRNLYLEKYSNTHNYWIIHLVFSGFFCFLFFFSVGSRLG